MSTNYDEAIGIDLDIIETIEARRLNWFGHLKRISNERWPRKVWAVSYTHLRILVITLYFLQNLS